jgi:tRNA-specific 2-thiouridylase
VGKVDLPVFLQQKLHTKSGDVIEVFPSFFDQKEQSNYNFSGYENIDDKLLKSASQPVIYTKESGKRIGEHQGAHFYTIGQRKGLNIGVHKDPLFIISTDVNETLIFVGEGQNHQGLFRTALFIDSDEIHWVRPDLKMVTGEVREYLLRIRYRQPLQRAKLFMKSEGLYVVFNEPQRGITPGQFAAWYENDELIGSGVIMS